jgi:hypothetical protein
LTCGATAGYDPPEDIRFIWTFELQILGSNGWAREDITALLDMVARTSRHCSTWCSRVDSRLSWMRPIRSNARRRRWRASKIAMYSGSW